MRSTPISKKTDTLKGCLGLRDLEEIQKKGIIFLLVKHFLKVKGAILWLGRYRAAPRWRPRRPGLYEHGDGVVLHWRWSGRGWGGYNPALRLASSAKV